MNVNVIIFGQLTDITGTHAITVTDVSDTNGLVAQLNSNYPGLTHATYAMAVDGTIISGNTNLADKSTIALLPPFSGG